MSKRIILVLISLFVLLLVPSAFAQEADPADKTDAEAVAVEAPAETVGDGRMTKWLIFDLYSEFPYRDETYTDPESDLPVKRRVDWIGAAIALSVNYDLMQSSNVWIIERSNLLYKFQQLYQALNDADRDTAIQQAKLENVSLNVNEASGLNTVFNADYMITGSFNKPDIPVVTATIEVRRADPPFDVLATFDFEGTYDELPALSREISRTIMDEFGLFPRPGTEGYWSEPLTDNLEAYRWMAEAITGGHSGKMIAFFERAMEKDPNFFITLVEFGKVLYAEKQYERAFEILEKATDIEEGANNQLAWLRRGNAYFNAASTIEQNIEYLSEPPEEDWELGDSSLIKNKTDAALANEYYQKALEYYQKSVEVDPGYVDGWISVATTQGRLEQPAEALDTWARIIEITEICDEAFFQLGRAAWDNKEYDTALDYFEQTIEINPRHVQALYNGAVLANALNDNDKALEILNVYFSWAPPGHNLYTRFDELFQKVISE